MIFNDEKRKKEKKIVFIFTTFIHEICLAE